MKVVQNTYQSLMFEMPSEAQNWRKVAKLTTKIRFPAFSLARRTQGIWEKMADQSRFGPE